MLAKRWFPALTKQQISTLRGGPKHNFMHFVEISESAESDVSTNIIKLKLKNQMGSQRSVKFPEGYEPFEASYGTPRLCLNTMTIRVPRLKLCVGWPNPIPMPRIVLERKPARVLISDRCTEAFHILEVKAEVFEIKHRIRRHAAKSRATLDILLSLMAHRGRLPLSPDPGDRFEAYLCLQSPKFLLDLLALLDMPDPSHGPIASESPEGGLRPRTQGKSAPELPAPLRFRTAPEGGNGDTSRFARFGNPDVSPASP